MTTAAVSGKTAGQDMQSASVREVTATTLKGIEVPASIPVPTYAMANSLDGTADPTCWLCPIQSDSARRGILPMTAAEYFDLVDGSGRMIRADKRGAMDADLAPILPRIGANPDAWPETVTRFGFKFRLAAGLLANLRSFTDQLGRRWLVGAAAARAAFALSQPQLA